MRSTLKSHGTITKIKRVSRGASRRECWKKSIKTAKQIEILKNELRKYTTTTTQTTQTTLPVWSDVPELPTEGVEMTQLEVDMYNMLQ